MTLQDNIKSYGDKVRTRRIQLGYTQLECSIAIGVSRPTWVSIETAKRPIMPSEDEIARTAKFLKMGADTLLGKSEFIFNWYSEKEQELLKTPKTAMYVKIALAKYVADEAKMEAEANLKLRQDIYHGRA